MKRKIFKMIYLFIERAHVSRVGAEVEEKGFKQTPC